MSRFALALGSLAITTLLSAPALADCAPGTGVCASVGIPGVQGQISVGIPPFVMPFPQATPAAPPPNYQAPDPGYEPAPYRVRRARRPNWGASKLGLDLRIMGAGGFAKGRAANAYGLGGAGIGLRYRALPHLGVEGGLDLLGGRDYNNDKRFEVVGSMGGMVFFNPRSRAQLYLSAGMLVDHARAWNSAEYLTYLTPTTTYTHFGGYGGLGLEVFATRNIAFHFDARGIVRQKVGGSSPTAEFVDYASGRSTNTSGGLVGSAGKVIYF